MTTSPWHIAAFRRLWYSGVILSMGNQFERLAIGWLVLVETDSVFLTAASFAVQKAPGTLIAPIAGDISDRMPRGRMLAITSVYKALIIGLLATLALTDIDAMWPVFLLIALSGVGMTFELPAMQGLITDIAPPEMAMKAVAMQSTGSRAVGALGSLAGGLVIASLGIPTALYIGMAVYLIGAMFMATMPAYHTDRHVARTKGRGLIREAISGLVALMRIPVVRTLLLVAFIVEMFAFAYSSVLPSLARDVLHVGVDGLGSLNMMTSLGALVGVAGLTAWGSSFRRGLLLIGATTGFGLALIIFASSSLFWLSLGLITLVGAMAAVSDALQWTMLQQHVPDNMRGRAIGGWMFVVGFGWMGQVALGAAAEAYGVPWALSAAGILVTVTGLAALGFSRRLRAA